MLCQIEILWKKWLLQNLLKAGTASSHSTLGWEVSLTVGTLGLPKVPLPSQDLQQLCNPVVVLRFIDEPKEKNERLLPNAGYGVISKRKKKH